MGIMNPATWACPGNSN